MNGLYRKTLDDYKAEGRAEGEVSGMKKGIFSTLFSLTKKGRLTLEEAAEEAGMTVAEFEKNIVKYS